MTPSAQSAIRRAQTILGDANGALCLTAEIPGNYLVLRCRRTQASRAVSDSVIVKLVPLDDAAARNRFLNEIACLEFLAQLPAGKELAPSLYGYDANQGILIMADMGDHPSVMDVLNRPDRAAGQVALLGYARFLGRLHAATVGQEPLFRQIQERLGATSPLSDSNVDLSTRRQAHHDLLAAAGVTDQTAFWAEFEQLLAAINASALRVFIHCDSGPQNMLQIDDRFMLLDYEFGDYGHAFLDVAGWRNGFQQSMRGQRVPQPMIAAAEAAYRAELARGLPIVAGDAIFYDAIAHANAHWTLGRLAALWRSYLQARLRQGEAYDAQWLDDPDKAPRYRWWSSHTFTLLRGFIDTSAELNRLPATRDAVQAATTLLQDVWPDGEPSAYFAAFS